MSSSNALSKSKRIVVLRRISVIRGKPLGANLQQRHVVIIPPNTVGNTAAIHGLLLDETANVTPHVPSGGCTLIHLTTTATLSNDTNETNEYDGMMQRALDSILSESGDEGVEEIFQVTFSYSLMSGYNDEKQKLSESIDGLHIVDRPPPGIEADPAFDQAARIFSQIVKEKQEFLAMSQAMDDAVKERIGDGMNDHDDDERRVLESAVHMISSESSPPVPTETPTMTTTTTTTTTTAPDSKSETS